MALHDCAHPIQRVLRGRRAAFNLYGDSGFLVGTTARTGRPPRVDLYRNSPWVAVGNTPQQALDNLTRKLKSNEEPATPGEFMAYLDAEDGSAAPRVVHESAMWWSTRDWRPIRPSALPSPPASTRAGS